VIQHVSLESRRADEEPLVRFFRALGFHPVPAPATLGERATWLQSGATQVHLLWADDPVVPPSGHLAVVADDYDATLAALRADGFEAEPRREHWGVPRAYVRSPGGHLVEVMAAPPPGE
jgi:catechol 2,3-dioxygenase-like lactoylglutathione lyase family enzyme